MTARAVASIRTRSRLLATASFRATTHDPTARLFTVNKMRADRAARHPAANKSHRRRARYGDLGHVSRCIEGITVAEHQVAAALTYHAASADIHAEQEIVLAVCGGANGSYGVAQTGQPSRHDGEAWQGSLGQVDVEGIVEQRFEWLDRFELFRQQPALTNVEVTDRLGTR